MSRITVRMKGRMKTEFPSVTFHGVFVPLHDEHYHGAISTNALSRRTHVYDKVQDAVAISFQANCSPTIVVPEFDVLKAISKGVNSRLSPTPISADNLDSDELRTIQLLMKLLGDEWTTIYAARHVLPLSKLTGSSAVSRLIQIQDMDSQILHKRLTIVRGHFVVHPEDYANPPQEFAKTEAVAKREIYRSSGPITAYPTLGHKGSTVGWENRKGGC